MPKFKNSNATLFWVIFQIFFSDFFFKFFQIFFQFFFNLGDFQTYFSGLNEQVDSQKYFFEV